MTQAVSGTIYTLGHSNHPISKFLGLLQQHEIQTAVDVRTHPRSRFCPQFNQNALKESLWRVGINYEYLGQELGGHPDLKRFYDSNQHVIYERLASTLEFRKGIKEVADLSIKTRLALVCTEENPAECHRHAFLAHFLLERNLGVLHIRGDGSIQDASTIDTKNDNPQLPLFELPGEDSSWRSPKRIQ